MSSFSAAEVALFALAAKAVVKRIIHN